jgi:hypothetical protein
MAEAGTEDIARLLVDVAANLKGPRTSLKPNTSPYQATAAVMSATPMPTWLKVAAAMHVVLRG